MVIFPNCKVNIGLNIVAKRADGFHNLETIFYPVPLYDILEIISAPDGITSFESSGLEIPGEPESNLCLKAFRLLEKEFQLPPVKIHLHKILPMGAGLGGGSADGAFTIRLLNDLFSLKLTDVAMENFAAGIGSDCPFFIRNNPVFATGKGEIFDEVKIDLSGFTMLLVVPPYHVGTAAAYAGISPASPNISVKYLVENPINTWKDCVVNDFELTVFETFPAIREIKAKLYDMGAIYASMTGSGSAVFGLFPKEWQQNTDFPGAQTWTLNL